MSLVPILGQVKIAKTSRKNLKATAHNIKNLNIQYVQSVHIVEGELNGSCACLEIFVISWSAPPNQG